MDVGPDGLTVAGEGSYRGTVEVKRHGRVLAVVNEVGFEDYVRGIEEVPPSWPAAALQAQAIAARTYAAHKAGEHGETPWRAVAADICATPRCQVYNGLDAERKARGHGWLAAVEATAGRVLLEGGRPIMASYSSTANGPRAMSQTGALEMANQGRSAPEILDAYYGLRPTHAPGRLPATIRVALDTGTAAVRVSATKRIRVVDQAGAELAGEATGDWKVVADGGGVRVVPPDGHPPDDDVVEVADPVAAVVRRPGRVMSAAAPRPSAGPWAVAAAALLAGAGMATITLGRRRAA
ncbi:MAG TPA: SpoIID/LytB domain-containing protein [Acidimicrobiales bacterium]|nr:SpoIID/LytB domain-containing protein [Acidimicrobiales bacterium]